MRRSTSRTAPLVVVAVVLLLGACGRGEDQGTIPPATTAPPVETTTTTATSTPTTPATVPAPALGWRTCGSNECATMKVPLDHDQPSGKAIDIAVARRKVKDPAKRIGSLVFNPGGPGASGVDFVDNVARRLPDGIVARFDIVGFDPRGVGSSTAVSCLSDARLDAFFHADQTPDSSAERAQLLDVTKEFIAGCQKSSGELLEHVGTADAARDMDLLRAALGDERLTYVGFSYGSELGAAYANLFPQRVRALVLDGAVDPLLSATEANRIQATGFDSALDAFLASCRSKASCAWRPTGGPSKEAFRRLMDAIDRKPIPGDGKRTVGPSEATLGAAAALYDERTWTVLGTALQEAEGGRGATLLQLFDSIVDRKPNGRYTNLQEAYAAVGCRDRAHPASVEEVEAAAAEAGRESPAFGATIVWSGVVCALWPVPAEPFPKAVGPVPQVLVIGTTNDPATPFVWAQALSKQLGARLLTYEGEGHTAYGKEACVNRHTDAYLLEGKLPPEGTTC